MENQIKKVKTNWENYNEEDECMYLNSEDLEDVLKENGLITDEIDKMEQVSYEINNDKYTEDIYYVLTNINKNYLVRNVIPIWGDEDNLGIDTDYPRCIYVCELSKSESEKFESRKGSKLILKDFLEAIWSLR